MAIASAAPSASAHDPPPVLAVEDLRVEFNTRRGRFLAVDGLSYAIAPGETLGVVGESGCGKSVSSLALLGLLPMPPARILSGTARFGAADLLTLPASALEDVRGRDISMVFQEPMTSLNPSMTIGRQVAEVLERHKNLSRRAAWAQAIELLSLVRIPEAAQRAHDYPHNLSGGMRQRVMVAIALACRPKLLIADEPTTALDVTIQAQILGLIADLQQELGTSVLLITHDLGVIAETAHRVIVMYAGRKVEEADVESLFERPRHPYTRGLMAARPCLEDAAAGAGRARLTEIAGSVPPLDQPQPGCSFAPRCPFAVGRCRVERPRFEQKGPAHWVACWESDRVAGAT